MSDTYDVKGRASVVGKRTDGKNRRSARNWSLTHLYTTSAPTFLNILLVETVDIESSVRPRTASETQNGSLTDFQIIGTLVRSQDGSPSTMCYA